MASSNPIFPKFNLPVTFLAAGEEKFRFVLITFRDFGRNIHQGNKEEKKEEGEGRISN